MSDSRAWTIPTVVGLAALMAFSAAMGSATTGGGTLLSGRAPDLAVATPGLLPASLQAPWADRADFNTAHVAAATALGPDQGSLEVTVVLWPSDLSLFRAGASGAPPLPSAAAVADRYGISPAEYGSLVAYLAGQGVRIVHTWPDRLAVTVAGTAPALSRAFGTTVEEGTYEGRSVTYPLAAPSLPAPYSEEVAAISGLSTGFTRFSMPFTPLIAPSHGTSGSPSPEAIRTTTFVYPTALHTIYGLDQLYNYSGTTHFASGVGIALILWGQGFSWNDINTFFSTYYPPGFPAVTVAPHPVDGAPLPSPQSVNDPSGATQEMTLDLEWSGSEAPGATLDAVYAPDGSASNNYSPSDASMETALSTAVTGIGGVDVISMSFGTLDGSDPSFQAAYSTLFAEAASRGMTVLAASGDTGGMTKSSCSGTPDPQFPASSPQVLAVGGTAPVLAQNAVGGVTGLESEPAWSGSGGGFSRQYTAPTWQEVGSAATPIQANGHRATPDVAGPAADNFLYFGGGPAAGKGTSFASPAWAGLVGEMDALRGQPLGLIGPRLYGVGAAEESGTAAPGLVDVTSGANCLGPAGPGWDTATGWGSPRALALYNDLSFSFVELQLSVPESSLTPGSSATLIVTVVNATSHQPIPNLPVTLSLTAVGSVGLCLGTLSTVNATTAANGEASGALSVPTCYFGTQAELGAAVAAGGFFGSNSTTLSVNLLGLAGSLYIIQVYPYNVIVFSGIILIAVLIGWALGRRRTRGGRSPAPPAGAAGGAAVPPPGPRPPSPPAARSAAPAAPAPPTPAGARTAGVSPAAMATASAAAVRPTAARPPQSPARAAGPPAPMAAAPPATVRPATRGCPRCGRPIAPGGAFCSFCGATLV